ncbi:MAG: modification methylase [Parcubacteria bacterium C7867-006]|nr:MAG: modification methylase [Parcubacteria bacterium C7867-006]
MTKLIWRSEKRSVKSLKAWKNNPRKITEEAFEKLKDRIKQRGFHDVIKIDTDGTVLSGNQRKKALIELGITEVTVLIPNRKLTNDERDKVALESNTNDGTWDFEGLKSFDLDTLTDIGFDKDELSNIWTENLEAKDDNFDVDKELVKITKPKTKLGDLIIMGEHKLYCGDSLDPTSLKKLFGKEKASMIYSDPVYNIKINYNGGIGGRQNYGGNVNDNRTDIEYKEFLRKSMMNALSVSKPDTHIFYWSDQIYIGFVQELYRELGIENKRVCLWVKNSQNPVPSVAFNKCYEPCTYGIRGKPFITKKIQNLNEVMNKEITTGNNLITEALDHLDLWFVKRLSGKEYEHATSKPPKLHEKAIRRCTKPGDIILDSFAGSSSTMICAEQLKRRVYAVELEPRFCDLAIRRYELLTGKKAKITRPYEEE